MMSTQTVSSSDPFINQTNTQVAFAFLTELAAEVSRGTVDLPGFPEVVLRLRRALSNPDTSADQLVKLIGTEPRLSARLMQTANSAAYNTSGRPIEDLKTAVMRLGQSTVQSGAMAFAMQQLKSAASLRPIAKDLQQIWKHSIAVAAIAQILARRTRVSPDVAFLTGLVHAIGRLYIIVRAVHKDQKLAQNHELLELVGGWHPSIGKTVLENWGFAEEMHNAVGAQEEYERTDRHTVDLTDVLVASVALSSVVGQPEPRTVSIDGISAFGLLQLSTQDCKTVLMQAELTLNALHAALGV